MPIKIHEVDFFANLIILGTKGLEVVLGMDWMSKHNGLIDCAKKAITMTSSTGHDDLIKSFAGPRAIWSARPIPTDNIQADIELYVRSNIGRLAKSLDISANDQRKLIDRLSGPKQTM